MQDATIHEILDFIGGIDPAERGEGKAATILARDFDGHVLTRLKACHIADGETVITRQPQCQAGIAILELQRQHTHANQIGAVDAFKAFNNHRTHTQQIGALGRPVAR